MRRVFVIAIVACTLLQLGLYHLLRSLLGLDPNTASLVGAAVTWSVPAIIVAGRVGHRWLSLSDYGAIHTSMVLPLGTAANYAALVIGSDAGAGRHVMLVALFGLPVTAVELVLKRVLFTPEEVEQLNREGWARRTSTPKTPIQKS